MRTSLSAVCHGAPDERLRHHATATDRGVRDHRDHHARQAPAPQILVVTPVQAPAATPPEALVNAQASPLPDVVTALLTYSERVRQLNPTDLAAEIAVQGDPGNAPLRQMQLALALMHSPQAVDTARALGLVQRVVGNRHPRPRPSNRWRACWPTS